MLQTNRWARFMAEAFSDLSAGERMWERASIRE
jgi:hypothetical protein